MVDTFDRHPVLITVGAGGRYRRLHRSALLQFLETAPRFHVLDTRSGGDALALLEVADADILLISDQMPDMNAATFCESLRLIRKASLLPVVVLASAYDAHSEASVLAAGADAYIPLPADSNLVRARVLTLLRRKWAADEREDAESILFALAQTVEQRDSQTAGHCQRLALLSVRLGRRLGLAEEEIETLNRGGYLHDIGKIAVPDAILNKPGPLTPAEWTVMRAHTTRGEEICRPLRTLGPVLPIIRSHHERWDGSGYPDRLRGEEIPLIARILQTADIYDALTTRRPYKAAVSHADAIEILRDEVRKGWRDPDLTEAFASIFGEQPAALHARAC